MKMGMDTIIDKIIFDMSLYGTQYKDVTLTYPEEELANGLWHLTFEDIHQEDNDSWCMAQVGNTIIDFQIYGNDDSLGMKSKLNIHACIMEFDPDNACYKHTQSWLYDFAYNVRLVSGNITKRIKLEE